MTNTIVVVATVIGGIGSFLALWVKDPLLPERVKARARRQARLNNVDAVAEELFQAVTRTAKQDVRNSRDRLSIDWVCVDETDHLRELAREADGWLGQPEHDGTRRHPARRHGRGRLPHERALCDLLFAIPTRRMFIAGEAGAGKSYLLNLLACHWKEGAPRRDDVPVPAALSLASWRPDEHGLTDWAALALPTAYPFLDAPSDEGHSWAQELVWRGRLLLLLDGFDEIPAKLQPKAAEKLLQVDDGVGFVITCRTEALKLHLSTCRKTALVIRPGKPSAAAIEAFLCGDRPTPLRKDPWEVVREAIHSTKSDSLYPDLSKPLYLDLASAIFTPRLTRTSPFKKSPDELISRAYPHVGRMGVREYLLHWFVPAAYAPRTATDGTRSARWTSKQAVRWLLFLAHHLDELTKAEPEERPPRTADAVQDIHWWQVRKATPRLLSVLGGRARGLFSGLAPGEGTDERAGVAESDAVQDIDWWQLRKATPRLLGVLVGGACGLFCGLAAGKGTKVGVGFGIDLGLGIFISLLVGYAVRGRLDGRSSRQAGREGGAIRVEGDPYPDGGHDPWLPAALRAIGGAVNEVVRHVFANADTPISGLAGGLGGGVLGGVVAGVLVKLGIGHSAGLADAVAAGLGIGVGSGPALGLRAGFFGAFVGAAIAGTQVGVGVGVPAGVCNGLAVACAVAIIITKSPAQDPISRPTWRPIGIVGGLAAGLAVAATGWTPAGGSVGALLPYVLASGVLAGVASGLVGRAIPRVEVNTPRLSLRKDRAAFLLIALTSGAATGVTTVALVGFNTELETHAKRLDFHTIVSSGLLTGVAVGVTCGLVLACVQSPWGGFAAARVSLAVRRKLPVRLIAFLEDARAADRGVLRTNGPSYRFRHKDLQLYLAGFARAAADRTIARVPDSPAPPLPPRTQRAVASSEPRPADAAADLAGSGRPR